MCINVKRKDVSHLLRVPRRSAVNCVEVSISAVDSTVDFLTKTGKGWFMTGLLMACAPVSGLAIHRAEVCIFANGASKKLGLSLDKSALSQLNKRHATRREEEDEQLTFMLWHPFREGVMSGVVFIHQTNSCIGKGRELTPFGEYT
jgi:hypothetical protein